MTDTLTVSLGLLQQLGSSLTSVAGEMKDDSKLNDVSVDNLASQDLVDAIHDFKDNWDNKREVLTGKISALGDMATSAHQNFTNVDEKLAAQIRDAIRVHT